MRLAERGRGEAFLYATNHFVSPDLRPRDPLSRDRLRLTIYRMGYLRWVEGTDPPRTTGELAALMTSHEPWAPCRHGGPHVSSTVWSAMALIRERRLLACGGSPCRSSYREYQPEG